MANIIVHNAAQSDIRCSVHGLTKTDESSLKKSFQFP